MNTLAPLRSRQGFTLVEVMVAMVVLALMMAGLATIIAFVSKAWLSGINVVDNFTKARVMLNLLDRDIQMMVMRRDVGAFADANGNSACTFYTKVQGNQGTTTTDTRALSLVQYKLSSSSTASVLQRVEIGLYFSSGTMALAYPSSNSLPTGTFPSGASATSQTETIGSGVIAFQWQFVDGSGNLVTPTNALPYYYNFASPSSAANYRAVVVSIAVMSNNAYTLALDTNNLATITAYFANPTTAPVPVGQTYAQVWDAFLANPSATSTTYLNLPAPLRGSGAILVFQRYIPLPGTLPASSS